MVTLDSIRKAIHQETKKSIDDGILGESIAIVHFEEIDQPFIHVQQDEWSKPQKLIKHKGKRPDFYLLPLDKEFIMVDVKHYSIGEKNRFHLSQSEILEYQNLIDYTVNIQKIPREKIRLIMFLIPKEHHGKSYCEIDFQDYLSSKNLHKEIFVGQSTAQDIRYVDLNGKLKKIMTKDTNY